MILGLQQRQRAIRLTPRWWEGGYTMGAADAAPSSSPQLSPIKGLLLMLGGLAVAGYLMGSFTRAGARGGTRGLAVRLNPGDRDGVERAREFREQFTWGHKAGPVRRVSASKAPRQLVKLGALESITYSTDKKGDGFSHYVHDFGKERGRGAKKKRPVLAIDMDNKKLHVIGGSYTVTERGIEG